MSPLTALRVAAAAVLAGAVGAVVWWLVAPVATIVIRSDGGFFVDPDPEQYAAADFWFGLVALVLGVLVGVLVWWRTRDGLAAVVGLALGGVLGTFVMRYLGQWLGRVDLAAAQRLPVGSIVKVPLRLQADAMLLVLPVTALASWLVCDLVADYRSARSARSAGAAEPASRAYAPEMPPEPPPR